MTTLRITVEWFDGAYHGCEWPPSPWRLYQAMRAGAAAHERGSPTLEAALRHLETLPPPAITAPCATEDRPVAAMVPNNDGDRVLELLARGQTARARRMCEKSVTRRTRRAWRLDGAVAYDWRAGPETVHHLESLVTIAASASAVGHGIDLAHARAALGAQACAVPGVRYVCAPTGGRTLAVPWPGAFDACERRYRTERERIDGAVVALGWEPAPQTARYRCELDGPSMRCAAFAIRRPDDTPLALEGTQAMEVAAMVRHAICDAALRAGLDARTRAEIMGHGADETRIRIQPLPSVGHRWADGRIRRILLSSTDGVEEADWSDVVLRLAGAPIKPEGQRTPVGILAPLASEDSVVARFQGVGQHWTTATPVVLPGYDHRRGRPRPQRTVGRLLRHAGIAPTLVESVAMEPAPRVPGSASAHRYRRPEHLAQYPCRHMSVRWAVPIVGPLALGAGVGYGLGLFVPWDECFSPIAGTECR